MNQQFWPQIGSSFQNVLLRSEGFYFLALVLALMGAACVIYFVKRYLNQKKEQETPGFFEVASSRKVIDVFDYALTNHSRFDLRLNDQGREILCALKRYDKNFLVLEPPSQVNLPKSIVGRDASVFFKVGSDRDKLIFYKFSSKITDLSVEDNNRLLILNMPESLMMEQKRQHLRLEAPPGLIHKLEIKKVSHDNKGNYHRQISSFGEPLWHSGNINTRPKVHLMNISGGGVKLKISTSEFPVEKKFLKENPMLLLSLILLSEPGTLGDAQVFHLIARVKKQYYDGFGYHIFGLQFDYRAVIDEDNNMITGWEMVHPEEGVEELTTWVVKTHLKLYREKGLT